MTPAEPRTFHGGRAVLWHGDCLDVVGYRLKENTFDSIITDPPYDI